MAICLPCQAPQGFSIVHVPHRGFVLFNGNRTSTGENLGPIRLSFGEEAWTDGSLSAYAVTVEAIKDDSGARVYEYLENDDATAA